MPPKKPLPSAPREDPQQYVLRKNYKKAVELYRAMSKDTPDDANTALRLADCLVLDGQTLAAVQEYKRAARLFAEQGFLLKAIGVNKKIVKLDPSQAEVHERLSKLYEERGLLAKPETARSPDPGAGGGIDFGMEEASDSGLDLDLRLGVSPPGPDAMPQAAPAPVPAPLPEPDLASDIADWETATADLAPEEAAPAPAQRADSAASGLGFDFGLGTGPAPAAAAAPRPSGSGLGGFDFGLGSSAAAGPSLDPPEEISLDALGDALSDDLSVETAVSAASGFGSEPLSEPLSEELLDQVAAPDPAAEPEPEPARVLTRTPLFSDFTPEEFVQVVTQLTHQDHGKGSVIVREGDPGDAMFVLVSGSVRVLTSAKGKELQLAVMGEGEFFGEGSLITGKPRTATIIAEEDTELLCLSRDALDHIAASHPRVRQVMMQFYEQRAKSTVQAILRAQKR